jgi:dihydroxy-acid dehydratase
VHHCRAGSGGKTGIMDDGTADDHGRNRAESEVPMRSAESFGKLDKNGFIHRSWMKAQGLPDHAFDGRPVIGICQTYSEFNPCHAHLRAIADHVKRGIWEAGGVPLEFPVMSLGETQIRPTAMLFRNLMSMDVEESIRGYPMDGVVLLGSCDKNTPAMLMGAASVDVPTIHVASGPMLNGKFRGRDIGSGTDVWRLSEDVRAGEMPLSEFTAAEAGMSRSKGTCMTMGTASTMTCIVEAMGLSLPYNATLPGVDSRRLSMAHLAGNRIVELVRTGAKLSDFMTRESFENGIRVCAAIGGSTNAVIHLLAMAGRVGVPLDLQDWDDIGRQVPTLVDLMPSGRYLMEDFHYAGGVPALLTRLGDVLHMDHVGVSGRSLAEIAAEAVVENETVIRSRDNPLAAEGGIAVLRGNLAPGGAVIKPSAASAELMRHRGRAVVFSSIEDLHERIDDPGLDVDESCVLVLQNCGPKGYPGMAEVGNMPLPRKLLEKGVRDMVRVSDARMSGTAFGTVVLHVAPEAQAGGPLALVRDGDIISLDVAGRALQLEVDEAELDRRRAEWSPPEAEPARGWSWLYVNHVMEASEGADFAFLRGKSGAHVARDSH